MLGKQLATPKHKPAIIHKIIISIIPYYTPNQITSQYMKIITSKIKGFLRGHFGKYRYSKLSKENQRIHNLNIEWEIVFSINNFLERFNIKIKPLIDLDYKMRKEIYNFTRL